MSAKDHWDRIYRSKASSDLSWYQRVPTVSLEMIAHTGVPLDAVIVDIGGGDSTLADHLFRAGYSNVTVVDISSVALERAQDRLGADASRVRWIEADILETELPPSSVSVWHDRAAFHFLATAQGRGAYVRRLRRALRPGGHVIVATFADDGPSRCSGLPVARYSSEALRAELGADVRLSEAQRDVHVTPSGVEQRFVYCRFER